jgi:glycerol-3-phosphate acyltransferase PlsX
MITISIDAMGGDHGVSVVVPAALQILESHSDLRLILVGDESALKQQLQNTAADKLGDRLVLRHASQRVEMGESPAQALRTKKDSSMRVAINLVKEGVADACVSAGNTGALMATARFVLKTLPGISRPAIITQVPTIKPGVTVRVLDLGANVDSTAEQLFEFAVMASVLVSAIDNKKNPTVALLNIGEEEIKGNEQVKNAAQLLSANPGINYIGYVEGDAIFKGVVDIIVCDGFVGNVMLKSCEGIARMIAQYIKDAFHANVFAKLAGLFALPVMKKVKQQMDPGRYNGASFIGLQGTVIKSHGSADVPGYMNAIQEAILAAKMNVPRRIADQVAALLNNKG